MLRMGLKIKGFNRIQKDISKEEALASQLTSVETINAATNVFLEEMQRVPPVTSRNAPGRRDSLGHKQGWYSRGIGYYSAAGTLVKLSQNITEAWIYTVQKTQKYGAKSSIVNPTTYYIFVHGNRQTDLMSEIGWVFEEDALDEAAIYFDGIIARFV